MKPNILFILVDGLRMDQIFGNERTCITPNMDMLTKNGTYFDQAISSADGTVLNLNSIFNSLHPYKTGVRAINLILTNTNYITQLRDHGYHIFGLVPKFTSYTSLIDFFENNEARYNALSPKKEYLWKGLEQKAIGILDSIKSCEPWFFFLHFMDLHDPLLVDKKFDSEKFGDSSYARAVSSIDYWIGKIIKKIDLKQTLLILTSDHGNLIPKDNKSNSDIAPDLKLGLNVGKRIMPKSTYSVGAKLFIATRNIITKVKLANENKKLTPYEIRSRRPPFTLSLYEESIRVPLIFAGYNISSKKISHQVQNVDIFPTIAEIIKLPKKNNVTDGRNLFDTFGNKIIEKPAYLHTMPFQAMSPDDTVGIRTSKYKYFRHARDSKKNINLYDLQKDPQENHNIAKQHPNVVKEMEQILLVMTSYDLEKHEPSEDENVRKKIEEEYRKLGYL